jgi:uncharacterized membrane protein
MPKLTYAENPVHPVINDYPAALVPASLAFDTLHLVTRRPTFRNAAFFSLLFAFLTGGAAAATGLQDYREIPEGTDAKRMANAHALLNVGVMGAVGLQLLLRMTGRMGLFVRLLNVATNGALMASSWYGSHLVYRHGMRVQGVDPIADAAEAMPDTGKPYADQLERLAQAMPATDLSGYANRAATVAASAGRQAQDALDVATREMGSRVEQVRAQAAAIVDEADLPHLGRPDEPGVDVAATVREDLPDDAAAG